MKCLYPILLIVSTAAATTGAVTLDSVRADPNPEHRAKAAVDFAVTAERDAEIANGYTDAARFKTDIDNMVAAMELARDSFTAAGKTPGRRIILAATIDLQQLRLRSGRVPHSTYGDRIAAVPLSQGSLIARGQWAVSARARFCFQFKFRSFQHR